MFSATATYPRACPDSSHFQSRLAHLAVGMTLLNASLFEQVDSTFPVCSHSGSFSHLLRDAGWTHDSNFKNGVKRLPNPSPERAFILRLEARVNRPDKSTQTCGRGEILLLRFIQFSSVCFDSLLHLTGMLLTLNLSKQISFEMIYYI